MVDNIVIQPTDAKERIKAAAARIFSLRGLEGARMQDIADEAQINKASFIIISGTSSNCLS